ncbi:MAG: helix-turn-helix domain-containing protein [Alkalilacustris sp.]
MIGRRKPHSAQPDQTPGPGPRGFDDYDLRLGDIMRGERATIGKSLLDVQRDLKIRASYIAAIENCDVGAFETRGFIAGYLRSYARYLGMDPEWAYARFCEEAGFTPTDGLTAASGGRGSASDRPLPRVGAGAHVARDPFGPGRFAPRSEPLLDRLDPGALGSVAVLALLIAGLAYGGWSVLQEVQRVQMAPADSAPEVLAELDPLAGVRAVEALDDPDLSAAAGTDAPRDITARPTADAFDRIYRPAALDVPVMVARDGPIAAIDPRAEGALADLARRSRDDETIESVAAAVARSLAGLEAGAGAQEPADAGTVRVSEAGPPTVEVLAVRPAWIRVQRADGTVLFERILDAGERYRVPALETPARLRAGNSGAVYFVVDGETFGPAAPGANIARNVELAPEALRDSFAVADLSRDPDLARIVEIAEAASD